MPLKKKGKTKAILNSHARRRALERHGINLSKELRHRIIADIESMPSGGSKIVRPISRYSSNRTLWEATVDGKTFRFIFDKRRHAIATVLPEGAEK